jgi:hypothetical protein
MSRIFRLMVNHLGKCDYQAWIVIRVEFDALLRCR